MSELPVTVVDNSRDTGVADLSRELAEGLASLLAAVVLLGVTHWMLGQLTAFLTAGRARVTT